MSFSLENHSFPANNRSGAPDGQRPRPERIRRNRPAAGAERIGARHPLDGRRRTLHHARIERHRPLQLRLRGSRREHAPRARAEPRHHRLRLLARRAVDPHCLGPQADLPPFVHHQLFTRARQRRAPRPARRRSAARRLLLARRAEDRLLGPQRSLRLRHRLPDHAPHHQRRGVERGDQRHDRLGTKRSSAQRGPTPSRPTAAASPTCVSTRAKCR